MYVVDALEFHARVKPHDLAVIGVKKVLSFSQLHGLVVATAGRLRDAGFPQNQPVGIYVADPLLHFVLILALKREALASFSAHPNFDRPPTGISFGGFLCDRKLAFMTGTCVVTDDTWMELSQSPQVPPERRQFAGPQSLVRIMASSGTTGLPKAIGLTAELADRRFDFPGKFGDYRDYPSVSTIGLSGSLGYRIGMAQLQLGNLQIFPSGGLDAVSAIKVYNAKLLTASPTQLQSMLDSIERGSFRLQSLIHVRLAGAAVTNIMIVRARSRLCSSVSSAYGSAEMGVVAEAPSEIVERIPGCAGYVHIGCQVQVVDESDTPLPLDAEGILRFKSPSGVSQYLGDPPEMQAAFRDGWFYPGDIGVLRRDGLLTVTGRSNEVINAGGVKMSPSIINDLLATQPNIVEAATFGVDLPDRPTEIWSAVVARQKIDERALIDACRIGLGGRAPMRIIQVEQLPRNQMGKVQVAELRRQLTGG